MPRGLTPDQIAAVAAPRLGLAVLIELEFTPEPMRIWAGIGRLAWGNRVFTGAGALLGIGAVEETSEVRATSTTLSLSGVPSDVIDAAESVTWQGRPARIWLALLTEELRLIDAPVQVLAGRMDTLTWVEGETSTVSLTIESRLVDLDRPRTRRYTDADQQAEYPGDRGFEYVASLVESEFRWGAR